VELALLLLAALLVATAWGAMPRPDARRVPAEDHGRAREDGPVITVIDHRDDERGPLRRLLPAIAGVAGLVAAVTAIVLGADL
jgi:hypothetical protein